MLFDSLKASGKTDRYIKHEGRITSAGNFAEAIAGGVIVNISPIREREESIRPISIPVPMGLQFCSMRPDVFSQAKEIHFCSDYQ